MKSVCPMKNRRDYLSVRGVMMTFHKYIYLLEHIRVLEYDDAKCPVRERKRLGFFQQEKVQGKQFLY